MTATRRARHPASAIGARKSSYGFAWNSFDVSARPSSPPVAASNAGTASAFSSGNQGITMRSASTAASGPLMQAIGVEDETGDIRSLSPMILAGVRPGTLQFAHSSCRGEDQNHGQPAATRVGRRGFSPPGGDARGYRLRSQIQQGRQEPEGRDPPGPADNLAYSEAGHRD